MFILTTVVDTIRIAAHNLAVPTKTAVQDEMDRRYPNRVLMDVGLVISRYGDCLRIGDGSCVEGDGGAHHECLVKLVIFRPFVDEVCTGRIIKSTADGIQVSLGFFQDIFIPPYWMLRPSKFNKETGLWVWTPNYDEGNEETEETKMDHDQEASEHENDGGEETGEETKEGVEPSSELEQANTTSAEDESSYVMELGDQIRFKVKSINFTQVTKTAKGMQATTTTTAQSRNPNMMGSNSDGGGSSLRKGSIDDTEGQPVRKRSLSVDLTESENVPASMHVVASICEDGLGLTSWWEPQEGDDEEEEEGNADEEKEEE